MSDHDRIFPYHVNTISSQLSNKNEEKYQQEDY